MSSGSASASRVSRLVNGENEKEKVRGCCEYGYGSRKENESGAAGSTRGTLSSLSTPEDPTAAVTATKSTSNLYSQATSGSSSSSSFTTAPLPPPPDGLSSSSSSGSSSCFSSSPCFSYSYSYTSCAVAAEASSSPSSTSSSSASSTTSSSSASSTGSLLGSSPAPSPLPPHCLGASVTTVALAPASPASVTGVSGVTVGTVAAVTTTTSTNTKTGAAAAAATIVAETAVSTAVSIADGAARGAAEAFVAPAASSIVVVVSGLTGESSTDGIAEDTSNQSGGLFESVEFEEGNSGDRGSSTHESRQEQEKSRRESAREIGDVSGSSSSSNSRSSSSSNRRSGGGRVSSGGGSVSVHSSDEGIETIELAETDCPAARLAHSATRARRTSRSPETSGGHARSPDVGGSSPFYGDNMVAAMNEHLSTSSATSGGARSSTVSTSTAASNAAGNVGSNCSRTEFQSVEDDSKPAAAGILSFPCDFDHMYASMTDGGAPAAATATSALGVSPLRGNEPRQNDLTEVKHLKELLLLHLDLIQQQSEQIVTKDKLLAALRQENETLKLRLERMDRRVSLQKLRSESSENSITSEHIGACSPTNVNSTNIPSTSEVHARIQPENNNSQYNESFKIRLNTSGGITTVKQEPSDNQSKHETKIEVSSENRIDWEEKKKRKSDPTPLSSCSKRKRGVSCSSTISNDTASALQDKTHESNRKADRKGKLLGKKESYLTTKEHYYTAVGDPNFTLNMKEPPPVAAGTNLEVPHWRVKVYTSCYTMEGTENLDDEIFNKRHLKLENDERRRKRWDVQRIREQRHIEKLKQRQERQNHQATCYNTNHTGPCPSAVEEETVTSLWPDVDQIQSLQVDPQLPVTAFGAPIPSFTPSEFSLPWSNTTRSNSRRPKRSTGRRKTTRR